MTIFSIAMGFLESSVVVYLRELYYPSGFAFPLAQMSQNVAITEICREIATIVMLGSIGFIAGKNLRQKLAWFIYCFAIWDIFYYVFLKVLIHWPESLFTWDILFLIPVIWTGPVLAPLIVSITMILMAGIILYFDEKITRLVIRWLTIILIITGSALVFTSFIWDFSTFAVRQYSWASIFNSGIIRTATQQYMPTEFNWPLFMGGELALLTGLYSLYSAYRKACIL
jgi:hypothetical protein